MYKFFGSETPVINRAWVDVLMFTANSPTGLYAVPESPRHEKAKVPEATPRMHEAH
ncbi:hypothetical protein ACPW96_17850 [Micromonospora sp. DT81.3]|uniref:hypothetical protein n=1 Tax=Micromonospora sp. DT81.3 TaxID=3416523 RepID=UPI003CE766CC